MRAHPNLRRTARLRAALRRGGFTLIEILAAAAIFIMLMAFSVWAISDAGDQALAAQRARELRMLAERQLGAVEVFESYWDKNGSTDMRIDDLPDEIRDLFRDWEWDAEVTDVTIRGLQKDENAPYLLGEPPNAKQEGEAAGGTAPGGAQGTQKGDTQQGRQVILRVRAPSDDGDGDSIEIVFFLPPVAAPAAPAPAPGGGGN